MPQCIDCMNFIAATVTQNNIDFPMFNRQKIIKRIKNNKAVEVCYCKITGRLYLKNSTQPNLINTLESCERFDNADE